MVNHLTGLTLVVEISSLIVYMQFLNLIERERENIGGKLTWQKV